MNIINPNTATCGFCGRTHTQVQAAQDTLYQGLSGFVCTKCVDDIQEARSRDIVKRINAQTDALPTPPQIAARMGEYIVGQDRAKKVLSVAVFEHYMRTQVDMRPFGDGLTLEKSNILLVGPTGTGKTHFARNLARILGVPFYKADATSLTEAGYVGDDVESILSGLLAEAGGDIQKAQKGIVFIDEVDKIRKASQNLSTTRDVGGEGVQQALLKLIEGTEVRVQPQGGRRHPGNDTVAFDTSNVLFICGGSFAGIEQLIADRKAAANTQSGIGFGAKVLTVEERTTVEKNILHSVTRADLTKFGMIPELLGRLPVLVTLDEMDEDLLVHVLTAPKDAIVKQMERLFFIQNVKLSFTDAGLRAIARKALAEGTGARGLRTIIEELLLETRFSMAADGVREVTVTASGDDLRVETKVRQAA